MSLNIQTNPAIVSDIFTGLPKIDVPFYSTDELSFEYPALGHSFSVATPFTIDSTTQQRLDYFKTSVACVTIDLSLVPSYYYSDDLKALPMNKWYSCYVSETFVYPPVNTSGNYFTFYLTADAATWDESNYIYLYINKSTTYGTFGSISNSDWELLISGNAYLAIINPKNISYTNTTSTSYSDLLDIPYLIISSDNISEGVVTFDYNSTITLPYNTVFWSDISSLTSGQGTFVLVEARTSTSIAIHTLYLKYDYSNTDSPITLLSSSQDSLDQSSNTYEDKYTITNTTVTATNGNDYVSTSTIKNLTRIAAHFGDNWGYLQPYLLKPASATFGRSSSTQLYRINLTVEHYNRCPVTCTFTFYVDCYSGDTYIGSNYNASSLTTQNVLYKAYAHIIMNGESVTEATSYSFTIDPSTWIEEDLADYPASTTIPIYFYYFGTISSSVEARFYNMTLELSTDNTAYATKNNILELGYTISNPLVLSTTTTSSGELSPEN